MSYFRQRPLLSIVIPTRERGLYLAHSLDTAIACKDPRLEIVVSDNASQDNTAAIVAGKHDPRIKYVRTPERVSVSRNFESAFSNASGEYILYIGDDDAVLPHVISELLIILSENKPDIVSWPQVSYSWPSDNANGLLRIRRHNLRGGFESRDPADVMRKVCAGESEGASVHCGCVSRKLVHTITSLAGQYHYYVIPDASAYGALAFAKSYIYLNRPVTVYGRSPASTTTALLNGSAAYTTFARENAIDASEDYLDLRCRSIFAFGLDGLMLSRRLFGLSSPPVNFEKWKERIGRDIVSLPEKIQDEQAGFVNEWLAKHQTGPLTKLIPSSSYSPTKPARRRRRKTSLNRIAIPATRTFMPNVDSATRMAEYIIGPGDLSWRRPWPLALLRWFGVVIRARLANEQWGPTSTELKADGRMH